MQLHVNSSLPRAGSELLQVLLSQHPDVYTSATSPLLEYWYGAYSNFGLAEVKSQEPHKMKQAFMNFCRKGTEGYYEALTDKPVIVDKSRGWLEYADWLWDVFPDTRIVCMTRKVDDIIASLERIYQQNPGHPETRELPKTARERAQFWKQPGSKPLGLAMQRLSDRQSRGRDDRILYLSYDNLVDNPIQAMKRVFVHLNLNPIEVDPNNVVKAVPEDDSHYGIFGKHEVHPKVERRTNTH